MKTQLARRHFVLHVSVQLLRVFVGFAFRTIQDVLDIHVDVDVDFDVDVESNRSGVLGVAVSGTLFSEASETKISSHTELPTRR